MKKIELSEFEKNFTQRPQGAVCIRHEWPQLGRALYDLEQDLSDIHSHLTDQQKAEQRERIKEAILEQCRAAEEQYEAFEFVRRGRAVEIVRNPHYRERIVKNTNFPIQD